MNTQITAAGRLSPQQVLEDVLISVSVDGSGSMRKVREETLKAANDYITELQSGTPITFSLAVFNSTVQWRVTEQPVDNVRPLRQTDYVPAGGTALYDAIGEQIERIEMMDVPPVHPVIVVFTDGDDLSSKKYTAKILKPMIDERRARGWRFVAFIVGQKARISTQAAGFLSEDLAEYSGDATSTKAAFKRLATSTKRLVDAIEMKALPPSKFLA
jgi:uncharacterized protein YegL